MSWSKSQTYGNTFITEPTRIRVQHTAAPGSLARKEDAGCKKGTVQYYGEGMGNQIAQYLPDAPDAIRGVVQSFVDVGADELFLWPTTPDVEQVEQLAEIVHQTS